LGDGPHHHEDLAEQDTRVSLNFERGGQALLIHEATAHQELPEVLPRQVRGGPGDRATFEVKRTRYGTTFYGQLADHVAPLDPPKNVLDRHRTQGSANRHRALRIPEFRLLSTHVESI